MGSCVSNKEFYSLLTEFKNPLFLCHRNADPDAVGSAYSLREVFGGSLGVIDGVDRISNTLLNHLKTKITYNPNPSEYDLIVVVDTSTRAQLNNIPLEKYCIIDHHMTNTLLQDAQFYLHQNTSSTAEIVYTMLHETGHSFSTEMGIALIAGIITDTGHFKHATSNSLRVTADLLDESKIQYVEVLDLLSTAPQDVSMRIAMIKAAMRAKIERVGDWIIATSHVSSFNGTAATTLVNIGADVAFVATTSGDTVRVSSRARRGAIEKGVLLSKILEELGRTHGGTGGGHDGAAGVETKGEQNQILAECVEHVKKILQQ
jgi:nanoRNase/pAp phosphatase (c-di-AMP/oligoRNAs hydrolase)